MSYEEKDKWLQGNKQSAFYGDELEESQRLPKEAEGLLKVVKAKDMPWENSRQGRLKHVVHEKMPVRLRSHNAYIQELPPGGCSGKHRHMGEEVVVILEGRGHDLHWDVEARIGDTYQWQVSPEASRHDWEAGDLVYIPPNTVHQHFNSSNTLPARFISATSRLYRLLGFQDLEQIEDALVGS